jgi:hypothetical protein
MITVLNLQAYKYVIQTKKRDIEMIYSLPFVNKIKGFFLFCIFLLFIMPGGKLIAQKQSYNWYFGNHAGVSFSTGSPVALTNGATSNPANMEGTATISDTTGKLLFYTDGQTVWNKNHVTMTNGTGLMGSQSSTQSAVIVPHSRSQDTFFIFTVDDCQHNLADGLRYSIVKMSLSGGLGAVTATKMCCCRRQELLLPKRSQQ